MLNNLSCCRYSPKRWILHGFLLFIFFGIRIVTGKYSKVRLKDVQILTFSHGHYTASRRSLPIRQMEYIGNSKVPSHQLPASIQCLNRGFDGRDVHWECKAQLDKNWRLGYTEVNCEGYDHADDPYILADSCGIRYALLSNTDSGYSFSYILSGSAFSVYIPIVGFLVAAGLIWYCCLREATNPHYNVLNEVDPRPPAGPGWSFPSHPADTPSAPPYPSDDPPSYTDSMRGSQPPPYRPGSESRNRRPWNNFHKYGWQTAQTVAADHQMPDNSTSSTSWISHGLSAGAGFLGGYLFGSRDTSSHRIPPHRTRLYPDVAREFSPPRPTRTYAQPTSSSHTSTSYAKTTRR